MGDENSDESSTTVADSRLIESGFKDEIATGNSIGSSIPHTTDMVDLNGVTQTRSLSSLNQEDGKLVQDQQEDTSIREDDSSDSEESTDDIDIADIYKSVLGIDLEKVREKFHSSREDDITVSARKDSTIIEEANLLNRGDSDSIRRTAMPIEKVEEVGDFDEEMDEDIASIYKRVLGIDINENINLSRKDTHSTEAESRDKIGNKSTSSNKDGESREKVKNVLEYRGSTESSIVAPGDHSAEIPVPDENLRHLEEARRSPERGSVEPELEKIDIAKVYKDVLGLTI